MNERAKYRGMLAELEEQKGLLEIKIKGLIDSVRDQLNPFVAPEKLKEDVIASQAVDLSTCVLELRKVKAEITAMEEYLGI